MIHVITRGGEQNRKILLSKNTTTDKWGFLKQNTFIIEHKRWTLHVAWNLTFWNENATKDIVC